MAIEKKTFVCSDATNNNNKFWSYEFDTDTNRCVIKYGRVGETPRVEEKIMSRRKLDAKVKEKTHPRGKVGTPTYKPPYREVAVIATATQTSGPSLSKAVVIEAATEQLAMGNPELSHLVTRLVEANKHELYHASGGKLDIDIRTGIVSTPVGVITTDTVRKARVILDALEPYVKSKDVDSKQFILYLNEYLMLVPQAVPGRSRGWHRHFFRSPDTLRQQSTLLDQLEASAELAVARMEAAKKSAVQVSLADTPNLFNAELKVLTDRESTSKIERMFETSINRRHVSHRLKPIKFYDVLIRDMKAGFDLDGAKMNDIRLLWHGTRKFNVLSILKSGFLLPKTLSSMQTTGAMFGNGVYFSDQSTKALNYSYGGVWDSGPRDSTCFMFLSDVAMGRYYVPRGSDRNLPKPGFDSTWAKANVSGVLNNEMIVYRTTQTNLRYLVEFSSY